MEIKNVFVVTPVGEEDSDVRAHAVKMLNKVFTPLESEVECSFNNIITAKERTVHGSENVFENIRNADIVIADMIWDNLNVFYEIGCAHTLDKPVILIGPKGYKPPFDITDFLRISYDKENFNSRDRDADDIKTLKEALVEKINILKNAKECELHNYLAFSKNLTMNAPEIIHTYESVIKDLKNIIEGQSQDNVVTMYIKGEENAFAALTEAVGAAEESILTTRLSPFAVKGRKSAKVFYQTIKNIMDKTTGRCPEKFERIVAANKIEKLDEVLDLVRCNVGKNFTIHLTRNEFSFEIVIIDKKTVFIHFFENGIGDEKSSNEEIISATLKVTNHRVANEFEAIFKSIVNNAYYSVCCNTIKDVGGLEKQIRDEFIKNGLNNCGKK